MIHFTTPFRADKNLGKAYNDAMAFIPDGDHNCMRDIDTLFLTPDQPVIIEQYVNEYPNAVLTCFTNRLSQLSRPQLLGEIVSEESDIREHIRLAELQAEKYRVSKMATEIHRDISGMLMVVPKSVWQKVPFPEEGKCLGVDTYWGRKIREEYIQILRMDAIYIFHTYRMSKGIHDKSHLK